MFINSRPALSCSQTIANSFAHILTEHYRLRVMPAPHIGNTREVQSLEYGRWHLDAAAPLHFGKFSYRAPSCSHGNYERPSKAFAATQQVRLHRRMKTQSLMRTRSGVPGEPGEEIYAQTPILELLTPLNTVCINWTRAEIQAGRRLVRFSKVQDSRRLIVSCETISQEEYCEQDNVISCIYQEETDTCFVTSVDVIYLLERLTNSEFPVEEKNRIRRNLEGLRPVTVSKHKQGYEDFFQRIMEFPDPKPRNIEKDLKVFKWNLLGQALEKILSKYSIYTTTLTESSDVAPPDTSLSETSDSVVPSFPYSPDSLDQPFTSNAMEPESLNMWRPDYEDTMMGAYDDYNTLAYDIVETMSVPSGNYSEGASSELAPYDLPFPDMTEQALNNCYM